MTDVTVDSSKIVIQTFKPKVVDMHSLSDLEAFQEAAAAVGVGLQWTSWRMSVEVGSDLYNQLLASGAVDANYILNLVSKAKKGAGVSPYAVPVPKKVPVTPPPLDDIKAWAADHGFVLSSSTSTSISTSISTSSSSSSACSSSLAAGSSSAVKADPKTPKPKVKLSFELDHAEPTPASYSIASPISSPPDSPSTHPKVSFEPEPLDERLKRVFKMSAVEAENLSVADSACYYDVMNKCIESEETFKKRVVFWEWLVACLRKGKEKGPFSYLCEDIRVHKYDVAGLYTSIISSVDIQNPFLFWSAFTDFVNARPRDGEDIFTYFSRITKLARNLAVREPAEVGVAGVTLISDLCLRIKMLDATTYWPQYKSFSDRLRSQRPSKWVGMTAKEITENLRVIHDSNIAMKKRGPVVSADVAAARRERGRGRSRTPAPNRGRSRSSSRPGGCPDGVCWSFWKEGKCFADAGRCKFKHERPSKSSSAPSSSSSSSSSSSRNHASGANPGEKKKEDSCRNCGDKHATESCGFKGKCKHCGKEGHKVMFCRQKRSEERQAGAESKKGSAKKGKPRANEAVADFEEPVAIRVPAKDA
jgi:hypothetical protein